MLEYAQGSDVGITNQRLIMWIHGFRHLAENPDVLFFGIGYGEALLQSRTGIAFYESFFLQTLMEIGVVGLAIVVAHFFMIWLISRRASRSHSNLILRQFLKGYSLFIPGFFLANMFGANMIQTDFLAPAFYFMLALCLELSKAQVTGTLQRRSSSENKNEVKLV